MKSLWIIFFLVAFLTVGSINSSLAQTPEQIYQKGLGKEEGEGALQEAINFYNQVADNSNADKSLQAKALLHVGMCYEKLGMKEATRAYQRLVRNFPAQKNEVAIARERLSRLILTTTKDSKTPLTPKFAKIEIPTKPGNGVLSPDGNKLAFIYEGAVWIIPIHGKINSDIAGEPVKLARIPGLWDNVSLMAWSADGNWIAVNGKASGKDAVYVIPVAGGEPRVVPMPDRGGHAYSYRLSLSPDGQMLAFSAIELNTPLDAPNFQNRRIYTIPVDGGKPKQVSSGWARLPSFSFDGKFISYVGYTERDDWPENTVRSRYNGDLWVVSSAGGMPLKLTTLDGRLRGPVWSPDGKYIAAHHEPGTDNNSKEIWVYPLSPDASRVGEPGKIALPRSSWNMLAGWTPNDELGVFIQSEEHAAIYTVPASGGMAVQITPAIKWPYYPRWSKNGDRIYFRGFNKDDKVSTLYIPAAGGDPVEIPVQSDRQLTSIIPGGGHNVSPDGKTIVISAYQKPLISEEGVDLWIIPLDGKPAIRLTNDKSVKGFPCWSPDGRYIAFTRWNEKSKDEGFNAICVIPSEGGEIRQISSETDSVRDGAITYSPDGLRITFFSGDAIKTISVEGGQTKVLVADIKYDSDSELAYSPDGSKIIHNAEGKIWITSLNGGRPQELQTGLPKDTRHGGLSWSPDGKKIAFTSSFGGESEFWMISNFLPLEKLSQNNETGAAKERKEIAIRLLSSDLNNTSSISADGEYVALADWDTGNLEIRNLKTGEKKLATNDGTWIEPMQYTEFNLISPDGKQVAYQWYNSAGAIELRLTKVDTQIPSILYTCDKDEYVIPRLWFPDSKKLIAQRSNSKTKNVQLFSIDITNRDIRVLKENSGKYYKVNLSLSPDQKQVAFDFPNPSDQGLYDISLLSLDTKQEIQVIKHPANDRLIGWLPGRNELLFTSDRSGATDIWSVKTPGKEEIEVPRRIVTNTGDLDPVGFTEDGSLYYLLSKNNYESFIIPCEGNGTKVSMNSRTSLPGQVFDVSWLPDGESILCYGFIPEKFKRRGLQNLFVVNSVTGEARALATNLTTSGQLRISPDGKSVLIFGFDQQRSNEKDYKGGIYIVNIETGTPVEIKIKQDFAPISGTFEWDKEGKNIFYAGNNQVIKHNIESGEEKIIYNERQFTYTNIVRSVDGNNLIIDIMVDKTGSDCQLFSINENGGEAKLLCTHKDVSNIRLRRMALSPDGKYIYFSSLPDDWKTGLKSILYRIPFTGGTPENLWQSKEYFIAGMSIHPEGNKMALSTLELGNDMRVIENLGEEVTKIYSKDK